MVPDDGLSDTIRMPLYDSVLLLIATVITNVPPA
jgi:hypothetical protein